MKCRENKEGKIQVWDAIRLKWVKLTPEEEVRQRFIHLLNQELQIPFLSMGVETAYIEYQKTHRPDLLIHDKKGRVVMIIEFKSPKIKLGLSSLEQISRYQIHYKVPFLVLTNGISTYCMKLDKSANTYVNLEILPSWEDLNVLD